MVPGKTSGTMCWNISIQGFALVYRLKPVSLILELAANNAFLQKGVLPAQLCGYM